VNTSPWFMAPFIATAVRLTISDRRRLCLRMITTYRRGTVREEQGIDDTAAESTESRRPPVNISGHARLSSRGDATSKVILPRIDPPTGSLELICFNSALDLFPVFFRYFNALDLQSSPEPTPFYPLNLLILVKDRANFIIKVCSPINRLQTYYRIFGSKSSESKDMARPNWLHSTVTISIFKFSFSYSTPF
jgi:hypothetical protein